MATLKKVSTKLTIKTKDKGSSSYSISNGALTDEIYDTAVAIKSLQNGDLSGYFQSVESQITS